MSLTLGTGPFAGTAAGAVNFDWGGAPAHRLFFEPYGRRLRAVVNVEDERALGSVRDPYHRVDVLESSREVKVSVDGSIIAESAHPKLVFETGLPPRAYVPPTDLDPGSLVRSETRSWCPYKGEATYWHLQLPDRTLLEDAAWSYETPLPEALKAQGRVTFGDAVEIDISG